MMRWQKGWKDDRWLEAQSSAGEYSGIGGQIVCACMRACVCVWVTNKPTQALPQQKIQSV